MKMIPLAKQSKKKQKQYHAQQLERRFPGDPRRAGPEEIRPQSRKAGGPPRRAPFGGLTV